MIEEPAEPVDEKTANEFDKLLKSKKEMSSDELDDFWDSAVQGQTSVPSSPDAITFEQAQQLGFKPGEEEI